MSDPTPLPQTFAAGFHRFGGHVWLNCAHQGPLPLVAGEALRDAERWKLAPYELTPDRFRSVPERLRQTLAALIGAAPEEVILGNSASYGLHLLANGLGLTSGDEVLVMATDFPSDILPWLRLERQGVVVRQLRPRGFVLEPDEIRGHIGARSRVLCLTWVHSFSGWAIDLEAVGALCREEGLVFVLNASQAIGARPIDVRTAPIDALASAGFKWLCGPYGTGFCWVRGDLLRRLAPMQAYWLATLSAEDLKRPAEARLPEGAGHRAFDVFGTANFFNYVPWTASIAFLASAGIPVIAAHDQRLVDRFIEGLNRRRFVVASPPSGPRRSTLVVFSHREERRNPALHDALSRAGVHVALRSGRLRVSPHLHNTDADIDRALAILDAEA